MPVTIVDKDYGFKRVELDIKKLRGRSIRIGLMGNEEYEGTSVVDIAAYNEFGTTHIPARPFMAKTEELYKEKIGKFAEFVTGRIIDGKITPDLALKNIGEQYSAYMKQTIRNAKTWAVPNSPKTIAIKGSTSPLIDTGRLVGSVSYEVD